MEKSMRDTPVRSGLGGLPIEGVLDSLRRSLRSSHRVVLQAEPGAGKTTGVPPALLDEEWLGNRKIVMLEPRRLAARMAAGYIAEHFFGEAVGATVGYRIRGERKIGSRTRLEVVTEGMLTRRIQEDPELAGIGLLIFDEFHERSLQTDRGLALALDVQSALRPDLRILVMSATLDAARLVEFLDGAPYIQCRGREHPVSTCHFPPRPREDLSRTVVRAVLAALAETQGGILVFLPGMAEIRRVADALKSCRLPAGVAVRPLHGSLPWRDQQLAVAPPESGGRNIVLATSIAETSLTIAGVDAVVDSGWMRTPQFDPGSGMTRLTTRRVTLDTAAQRRGRAGRLGPGECWRLWSAADEAMFELHGKPEILSCDLSGLALELLVWGVKDAGDLKWLDPPDAAAWRQAVEVLGGLRAVDSRGAVTGHGREMNRLGTVPRLAHMIIEGRNSGRGGLAVAVAALLSEQELPTAGELPAGHSRCDLRLQLDVLARLMRTAQKTGRGRAVLEAVRDLGRRIGLADDEGEFRVSDIGESGRLIAMAFPEQVGRRRGPEGGDYLLAGGKGACLDAGDALAREEYLAVAATDGKAGRARIFSACPLGLDDIEELFADRIVFEECIEWQEAKGAVQARRIERFGALALREEPLVDPDPGKVLAAFLEGVSRQGLGVLPWTVASEALRHRVEFLRKWFPEKAYPDLSDAALIRDLENWLGPFVHGFRRLGELRRLDMSAVLSAMLPDRLERDLGREAPTHLCVPSGSRIRLDYTTGVPVLAVKIQEMFGQHETPTVASGRVCVLVHLLSPGGQPVQVTQDLASFWKETYFHVRKELRGRYPKHPWPDDPVNANPTRKTKRQLG